VVSSEPPIANGVVAARFARVMFNAPGRYAGAMPSTRQRVARIGMACCAVVRLLAGDERKVDKVVAASSSGNVATQIVTNVAGSTAA